MRVIFFDIDGTLLTEWPLVKLMLPQVYEMLAKKLGVSKKEAREIFLGEIEKRKGTYEWYDWNFFFSYFNLPLRYEDFIRKYPEKIELYPGVREVLKELSGKYKLGIITSGPHYQLLKLKVTDIDKFFDVIITRDDVKAVKPSPKIFLAGLERVRAKPTESLMVGDSLENDILGAKALGFKTVWINRGREKGFNLPDFEIYEMKELIRVVEVAENEKDI